METVRFNTVWFALTYRCNNNCLWCYAKDSLNRKEDMPLALAIDSIDLIKDLNAKTLIFIGGEPTLYEGLTDIIIKSRKNNILPSIVTNGRAFSNVDFVDKILDAGLEHITFSVESYNSQEHDAITRSNDSFNETIKGIRNTVNKIEISTETTIGKNNHKSLKQLINMLNEEGVKKITFNICTSAINYNYPFTLSPTESAEIFEELYYYGKEKGLEIKLITPLPICNFNDELQKELLSKKLINGCCHTYFGNNFVIDYNMDILPCVHFTDYPIMNIKKGEGIISKEEFIERYNDKNGLPYRFRDGLWQYPSSKCKDECFSKCNGGCLFLWFKYDPEKEIIGIENLQNAKSNI